jgi:hypothetical protein
MYSEEEIARQKRLARRALKRRSASKTRKRKAHKAV